MSVTKIQTTKNYGLFKKSKNNREVDLKKRKKLVESMREYGFMKCWPIVCVRDPADGMLAVEDGQTRFAVAFQEGLEVHWIEADKPFDVAIINCTQKVWSLLDYARKWAKNGKDDYQVGMDFATKHGLSIGISFALLAGTTGFSGRTQQQFISGEFVIKDQPWAELVARLHSDLVALNRELRKLAFMEACMAVSRVEGFDSTRLYKKAKHQRDKLLNYGSRDAYLEMLEEVYNFNVPARQMMPLKVEAQKIMRERSATVKKAGRPKAQAQPEEGAA